MTDWFFCDFNKPRNDQALTILCKKKPNKVVYGMDDEKIDSEGRVIKIEYDNSYIRAFRSR